MALHLGESEQLKVIINNVVYKLNFYSSEIIEERNTLLSYDDLILLDLDGIYLTAKESD